MNTITHPFTPEEIMAFVDGELSDDRVQALSAHFAECAECSKLASDLGGLSQKMNSWQVDSVPERIIGRVRDGLSRKYEEMEAVADGEANRRRRPLPRFAFHFATTIAVVLLLMAIAMPNLLRSRMAANEASAVGSLRTLNIAAVTYFDSYGHYPRSLENFGSPRSGVRSEQGAGLIDDVLARGGRKSGYLFTYRSTPPFGSNIRGSYIINADPLEPGKGGQRHFSTDQTGTLYADGVAFGNTGRPEKSHELGQNTKAEGEILERRAPTLPMIARKAQLEIVVAKLDDARPATERIVRDRQGYVAQLSATVESGSARILDASLRIPADQLDACLVELKKLGRVIQESQSGEEVTEQHIDLVARLKNSRNTEARLNGVLQQRNGPVKEILEVEKESARVRGEIEQMEAEQQALEHRVNFATIDLKLAEEYQAQLSSSAPSVGIKLRNATVNGFRNASETLLGIILFFAESGPTVLLWVLILLFPVRFVSKRYKRQLALS
jgi:type II secretory pathway pseudopilin PulG